MVNMEVGLSAEEGVIRRVGEGDDLKERRVLVEWKRGIDQAHKGGGV